MSEFEKYEAMRLAGRTAAQVYEVAKQEGVDSIARIRLIRAVFGLDLVEAKEVSSAVDNGKTLNESQQELVGALEAASKEE